MKNFPFAASLLLLLACTLLPSCNDDTYDTTTSGECIIKTVTLGSLKCYRTTTSSTGADSIYKVNVTGSLYPITIDQTNLRIFNADSLPVGTDMRKVIFSQFTTSATMSIRSLYTGEDTTFVYSDSTDFSQPRVVKTYATDGESRKAYTIELRCHKEEGDSTTWTRRASSVATLKDVTLKRAFCVDGTIYAFALNGTQPQLLKSTTANATAWTATDITGTTPDLSGIAEQGGTFYALADGKLAISTDGATWTTDATTLPDGADAFTSLITVGTQHIAALAGTQIYSSTDKGATWTADDMDTDDTVPTTGIVGLTIPSATDATFEDLMLIGTKDGEAKVWKRAIDLTGDHTYGWVYYPPSTAANNCPVLTNPQLLNYDKASLLTGTKADGTLDNMYMSYDNGRSWFTKYLRRPRRVTDATSIAACTDGINVFLLCSGTGDVWAGRINRMAWDKEDEIFE